MFAKKVSSLIKDVAVGVAFLGGVGLRLCSFCWVVVGGSRDVLIPERESLRFLGLSLLPMFIQGKCCLLIVK